VKIQPQPLPVRHQAEFIRDVPRSCSCTWEWQPGQPGRWLRIYAVPGCAYHLGRAS
jgi:hypothetical protein